MTGKHFPYIRLVWQNAKEHTHKKVTIGACFSPMALGIAVALTLLVVRKFSNEPESVAEPMHEIQIGLVVTTISLTLYFIVLLVNIVLASSRIDEKRVAELKTKDEQIASLLRRLQTAPVLKIEYDPQRHRAKRGNQHTFSIGVTYDLAESAVRTITDVKLKIISIRESVRDEPIPEHESIALCVPGATPDDPKNLHAHLNEHEECRFLCVTLYESNNMPHTLYSSIPIHKSEAMSSSMAMAGRQPKRWKEWATLPRGAYITTVGAYATGAKSATATFEFMATSDGIDFRQVPFASSSTSDTHGDPNLPSV